MKRNVAFLVVGMVTASAIQVWAHHSVTRVYDDSRAMTIEGHVARFLDRTPHALVHLVVPGDRGTTHTWAVEFDTVNEKSSPGVSWPVLRPGDRITVCGNPGRDAGAFRLLMLTLERRSDGMWLSNAVRLASAQCSTPWSDRKFR